MKITDDYINSLFEGCNFGEHINNSVEEKRKKLKKSLRHQTEGFWSGHTMYYVLVHGGLIIDAKSGTKKRLTALGKLFMQES